jgi:predicted nucleic acid-binding protein
LTGAEPVLLDTDTLSELSRGNARVCEQALAYLSRFGRLTITSITVFERLRGYRLAIRNGRPYQRQMQAFQTLVASSDVLPFDESAAGVAGEIWSRVCANRRCQLRDILIAAIAMSRQLPLVTRNRRDFEEFGLSSGAPLRLLDWSAKG